MVRGQKRKIQNRQTGDKKFEDESGARGSPRFVSYHFTKPLLAQGF